MKFYKCHCLADCNVLQLFSHLSKAYENKPIGVEEPGRLTVALGVLIFRELAEIVGDFPAGFAILTRFFLSLVSFLVSCLFIICFKSPLKQDVHQNNELLRQQHR